MSAFLQITVSGSNWPVCPSHLVDLVLEAQDLGEGVQDVDGEAFVPLGLPQDVFCHHDERILLWRDTGRKCCRQQRQKPFTSESSPNQSLNLQKTSGEKEPLDLKKERRLRQCLFLLTFQRSFIPTT